MSSEIPPPPLFDGPGGHETDTRELLVGYLDWYRETLLRKLDGLTDEQLRTPVQPMGWSPLGLVQHLGWVERRWLRWGFTAEQIVGFAPDADLVEWRVAPDVTSAQVLATYQGEVDRARSIIAAADLDAPSSVGGRFPNQEVAPPLVRILFHLLQEYARHVGHLDIAREIVDGAVGE
jgi:uncharacterized damage-inducible protein DinB